MIKDSRRWVLGGRKGCRGTGGGGKEEVEGRTGEKVPEDEAISWIATVEVHKETRKLKLAVKDKLIKNK